MISITIYQKQNNNFNVKDFQHRLSNKFHIYQENRNTYEKSNVKYYQQQYDFNRYHISEQIYYPRRNFTNSQFQRQDSTLKLNINSKTNHYNHLDKRLNSNKQFNHHQDYNYHTERKQEEEQKFIRCNLYESKCNRSSHHEISMLYKH